jgi:hypothetical protein
LGFFGCLVVVAGLHAKTAGIVGFLTLRSPFPFFVIALTKRVQQVAILKSDPANMLRTKFR